MRAFSCAAALPSSRLAAPAQAATVKKGPAGDAFYTPPDDPAQGHARHADLAAQADRQGVLTSAKSNTLLLYRSTAADGNDDGRLRHGRGPEGQGAEGRLAGGHLGARHDRHRRRLRAVDASAMPGALRPAAAQPLAEGGLRGRAHGLRGPRHARRRTRT